MRTVSKQGNFLLDPSDSGSKLVTCLDEVEDLCLRDKVIQESLSQLPFQFLGVCVSFFLLVVHKSFYRQYPRIGFSGLPVYLKLCQTSNFAGRSLALHPLTLTLVPRIVLDNAKGIAHSYPEER